MQKEHIFVKPKDIPKSYIIIYNNFKKIQRSSTGRTEVLKGLFLNQT